MTLEDEVWKGWTKEQIQPKVDLVLDEFLKIWNEKMPTCENDYSRTRREVKAYWVSLFVGAWA